ncbi:MAG: AMP-binding protein [Candidatus Lokiarchaeota archaeon]|nr:AMP-binding protein [Candidatus Lokiarchaeota archaeon]
MNLAYKTLLYGGLYRRQGIEKDSINGLVDLKKLPTVSKSDLTRNFYEAIGKPRDVVKFHTTSGTSGTPTVVAFTHNDWDIYVKQNIKCLRLIGANKYDIIYNATPYGMFFAGLVLHDAIIGLGAKVIPAGALSSTSAHFNLFELFKPTVYIGIPQYLLKLAKDYLDIGKDPRELAFERAYCLGEPLNEKKRKLIEDLWDIEVYCGYGLSEIGAGSECCEKVGFHWPVEDVHVEVLEEHHSKGELTYTTLRKTGTLAIRFRSRDLGHIIDEPCACGDKSPLISHIEERLDDLVKIKGTLISPYAIDSAMYSFKNVRNYLFVIEEIRGLDNVTIYIEGNNVNSLLIKKAIKNATFITPNTVKMVSKDSIPLIGRKGKRFIDLRKENSYNNIIQNFAKAT